MTTSHDAQPTLTDKHAEYICRMIAAGYGKGGFPMDENGKQVGWYDWLRNEIARAALAPKEPEDAAD